MPHECKAAFFGLIWLLVQDALMALTATLLQLLILPASVLGGFITLPCKSGDCFELCKDMPITLLTLSGRSLVITNTEPVHRPVPIINGSFNISLMTLSGCYDLRQ